MSRRISAADIFAIQVPAQPALSPDGTVVVYALRSADRDTDENRTALWRASSSAHDAPVKITRGAADSVPAWAPAGGSIAFLRSSGDAAQIWLLPANGGEAQQLTSLPLGAGEPIWSPDSCRIAFVAPVDPDVDVDVHDRDRAGHDRAAQPIAIERLGYKADGHGYWRQTRHHVFVVDVSSGRVRRLTRGDWHAGRPSWSPDGSRLAFAAAVLPDDDLTGASCAYVVDIRDTTAEPTRVGHRDGRAGPVIWTPDGDALVVVGRIDGAVGLNHLLRVSLDGDDTIDLTAQLDRNVMPGAVGYPGDLPQFASDRRTLLFCARDRGCTHLFAVPIDGTEPPRLVLGGADRVVSGLSVASTANLAAVIVGTPTSYGDVEVVDAMGAETVLVSYPPPAGVDLVVPEERTFHAPDGVEVHGWLLRDPTAPSPAPLLLDVHGGPHNAWSPAADPGHVYHQVLAARGWSVLLVNPRGSDGYGESFFTSAVGSWGLADEQDLLTAVDHLVAEGVADPQRLAVAGYSYGGYMTCWLTGRTDRFAAAVAGAAAVDLRSLGGSSDHGHRLNQLEHGALPHEDADRITAQSPYAHVAAVTTPTLTLHGIDDERCPVGQAEQWFTALRARGVPARLVLYPGASHAFILEGRPSHREDYSTRIVDWVVHQTSVTPPPAERPQAVARTASWDRDHWLHRLAELAGRFGVPGAAVGVVAGEQTMELAHGVTNIDTGVEVTTDTLFQIGSISKVLTATVVMTLVDAGELDLDEPVISYLPGLSLADAGAAARVTTRHLLTHTSGIDGDFVLDTGRGDDCLERFVSSAVGLPQNHPLGSTFSYCNAGYDIAGRLIERLSGHVWDAAMHERLYAPLGLSRTTALPEQAVRHRVAVGHVHEAGEPPRRMPMLVRPRSSSPCGSIWSTVGDVLAFTRMHLAGGLVADGARVLSPDSVTAMQAREVAIPDPYTVAESWGLGWFRPTWDGAQLVGHDGATVGQAAFLRALPDRGFAVVLLTNGGFGRDLYETLVREIFRDLAGVEMAQPLAPPAGHAVVDPTPYLGTYERSSVRFDVSVGPSGLRLRQAPKPQPGEYPHEPVEFELVAVRDGLFVVRNAGAQTWKPVTFYRLSDGSPYLHFGVRATPKVA